jgi:predicted nucleic acid-binding protein
VYLVDTDIVSRSRRRLPASDGVVAFFRAAAERDVPLYVSAITIGEIRRGAELMRHRGDNDQAHRLATWLDQVVESYGEHILAFDQDVAQVWGRLRVPHPENPLDKQIAATALVYGLVLVTHNVRHFAGTGVELLDPLAAQSADRP